MNLLFEYFLKVGRQLYGQIFGKKKLILPDCQKNPNQASKIIYDALINEHPCMIARFGSTELSTLVNYIGVKNQKKNLIRFIQGYDTQWWWNKKLIDQMQKWSGFFPPTQDNVERFCELMLKDIPLVDVLGSWLTDENIFESKLSNASKLHIELLNPYFTDKPWTAALENKKVLVVHPFSETIEQQYYKREFLFPNNLLPQFELKTIKAVQSIAGTPTGFKDWFEALDYMKGQIDEVDYDICLLGCGAYGFPLAAHIKKQGKKGFHLGGSLQLLFGIKGKRWENPNYNLTYNYSILMNEHWVYPDEKDKPTNASIVEGACYW